MFLNRSRTDFSKRKKVPTVLQFENVECGAASLSMILRRWKLFLPLGVIRRGCGVNRDGSNLKDISNYGKSLGLKMKGKKIPITKLLSPTERIYPCIAFWDYCHFVVIEGVSSRNEFYISDPAMGHYKLKEEEFQKFYSGVVLIPSKTESFKPGGKAENELSTLITYLSEFKISIAAAFLLTLVTTIPVIANAGLQGAFVNDFLINKRYAFGIPIIWISLAMILLAFLTSLTYQLIYRRMLLQLMRRLSVSIAKKILSNEYIFYLARLKGDIAARLMLGTYIAQVLITDLVSSVLSVAGALLLLPFLFYMSWQLAVASLAYVLIAILMMTYFTSTLQEINRSLDHDQAKVDGSSAILVSDREILISTSQEQVTISGWLDRYTPVLLKTQLASTRMNLFTFIFSLTKSIYQYGTIVLSGYLVIEGDLNLAGFMAFQALRSYVVEPLSDLAELSSSLQSAEASLGRLTDLFSVADDPKVRSLDSVQSLVRSKQQDSDSNLSFSTATPLPNKLLSDLNGDVDVRDLSLQFGELKEPIIKNISFKLRPGEMVTIVGPSGSGKSTLIKLLTGLYDPTDGDILYSGHQWLEYEDLKIREQIGYVSQEISGFRGTVRENISIYNKHIKLSDVRAASKLAELDNIILNLEQGYNTNLSDGGGGLSGGQLQRLEIARAIVQKPKLIFLDEATSSLDVPTERQVLENLRATGSTLVCVAHRLVSAEMSDYVLVLDQGELMEFGSPKELKTSGGLYADLLKMEER